MYAFVKRFLVEPSERERVRAALEDPGAHMDEIRTRAPRPKLDDLVGAQNRTDTRRTQLRPLPDLLRARLPDIEVVVPPDRDDELDPVRMPAKEPAFPDVVDVGRPGRPADDRRGRHRPCSV